MFPTVSAQTLSAALDSHGMSARKAGCLFILRCATVPEKEIKDVVSIFRGSNFSRAFRDASAAARLANMCASKGTPEFLPAAAALICDDAGYLTGGIASVLRDAGLDSAAPTTKANGKSATL